MNRPDPAPADQDSAGEVTRLFFDWRAGDRAALEELTPLLYGELHRIAARLLRTERADHTLEPTALVNEAYLRIFGAPTDAGASARPVELTNRVHFFALASRVMRNILVDHARRRNTQKRGGGRAHLALDEAKLPGVGRPDDLIALDEALVELEEIDPRKSRIVELRFFGGLTLDEVAHVLEMSPRDVWEQTELAKAWLYRQIGGE